jgi:hypothetical protein
MASWCQSLVNLAWRVSVKFCDSKRSKKNDRQNLGSLQQSLQKTVKLCSPSLQTNSPHLGKSPTKFPRGSDNTFDSPWWMDVSVSNVSTGSIVDRRSHLPAVKSLPLAIASSEYQENICPVPDE